MVVAKVNADNSVGCVVEVNSETDFVANTDEFKAFVNQVADTIIEKNPADVEALKATTVSGNSGSCKGLCTAGCSNESAVSEA